MARDIAFNQRRSSTAKQAVNAVCRAVGQSQGGTILASTPYAPVEAGRDDPARENATEDLFQETGWGGSASGQPGRYCKQFGSEDNASFHEDTENCNFPRW